MSREIKFRAWDKKNQKWYDKIIEWVFDKVQGSIGQLPELLGGIELMQYTGLKDKNGKEIYEGDIVYLNNNYNGTFGPAVVKFENGGFSPFSIAGWEDVPDSNILNIIGNIYENPELLK